MAESPTKFAQRKIPTSSHRELRIPGGGGKSAIYKCLLWKYRTGNENKKAVLSQRCPRDAQSDNTHMFEVRKSMCTI